MKRLRWMTIMLIGGLTACSGGESERASRTVAAGVARGTLPAATAQHDTGAQGDATNVEPVALPKGAWTDLATRLNTSTDLRAAVEATREVLARGGIATHDGQRVLVAAHGPASPYTATPLETLHLAMEARDRRFRARLTVAEFAQMLETLGWPFPRAQPRGHADPPDNRADTDEVKALRTQQALAAEQERVRSRNAEREAFEAWKTAKLAPGNEHRAQMLARIEAADGVYREASTTDAKKAASKQANAARLERNKTIDLHAPARAEVRAAEKERSERQRLESERERLEMTAATIVGPDRVMGEHLQELLERWVLEAAKDPHDPSSFTPLFIAEMLRLQDAPMDLLNPRSQPPGSDIPVSAYEPRSMRTRLTLLEMELIVAAFHRPVPPTATAAGGYSWGTTAASALADLLLPAAHAAPTPCSDAKNWLGPDLGELHAALQAEAAGYTLGKSLKAAYGEIKGKALGQVLSATATGGKIIKLAAFYAQEQVTVRVDPTQVHKALGGTTLVRYTATAGVDPEQLKQYEEASAEMSQIDQQIRDCMGWLGLPTVNEISEIAKDAEKWLVDWRLVAGAPPHAYWSLRNNDFYLKGVRQAVKLKRVSPSSAEGHFVVEIKPEKAHTGKRARAYVTARAEVDAAGMPSLSTFFGAAKGVMGITDALTDIATGWIMSVFKPKAYASVAVDYHCTDPITIHRYTKNPVASGQRDDSEGCEFIFDSREQYEVWKASPS